MMYMEKFRKESPVKSDLNNSVDEGPRLTASQRKKRALINGDDEIDQREGKNRENSSGDS